MAVPGSSHSLWRQEGLTFREHQRPEVIRPLDVAWRVPLTFLARLFDDNFWTVELPDDSNLLRAECFVGYCFNSDKKGNPKPVKAPLTGQDGAMKYIPDGFHRLSSGDIVSHDYQMDDRSATARLVDTMRFWKDRADKCSKGELQRSWTKATPEDNEWALKQEVKGKRNRQPNTSEPAAEEDDRKPKRQRTGTTPADEANNRGAMVTRSVSRKARERAQDTSGSVGDSVVSSLRDIMDA